MGMRITNRFIRFVASCVIATLLNASGFAADKTAPAGRLLKTVKPGWIDPKFGKGGADGDGNSTSSSDAGSSSNSNSTSVNSTSANANGGKNNSGTGFGSSIGAGLHFGDSSGKNSSAGTSGENSGSSERGGRQGVSGDSGGAGPGEGPRSNSKIPDFWIPICFIIDSTTSSEQINAIVKANVDSYGDCNIAMQPFVFRSKDPIPDKADRINELAESVCPLNKVFGVGGSAAQTIVPHSKTADEMCRSMDDKNKPWSTKVAGCSVLGNGNGGSGVDPRITRQNAGNYGAQGKKGVPATSIVDGTANYSPGVSCHELGHSVGGPMRGGDYLVNVGDGDTNGRGQPAQANLGLEAQSTPGGGTRPNKSNGGEGADLGSTCSFTEFGCASLRGGSNPNTDRYAWNPDNRLYYNDQNKPGTWDFLSGKSFFGNKVPPSGDSVPPISKEHPRPGVDDGNLTFNDNVAKGTTGQGGKPSPTDSGHKTKPTPSGVSGKSVRSGGGRRGSPNLTSQVSTPVSTPLSGGKADNGGLFFDENAKKGDTPGDVSQNPDGGASVPSALSNSGGGGGKSGGLFFNDNAKKSGGEGSASGGDTSAGGSAGSGSGSGSGRGPQSSGKGTGSKFDESFFDSIKKEEKKREKRVRGGSLRKSQLPSDLRKSDAESRSKPREVDTPAPIQ